MRKATVLILAAASMILSGCGNKEEKNARPTFMFGCFRQEIVSTDYHVPDMATPEAAEFIQTRLKTMPGYIDSSHDLDRRILTISYRSSLTRSMNFEEAIALRGFAVNTRPASPKAKLPEGLK